MQKRTIHTVLAELISRDGIRPTELSRRTGVPQSTISRILNKQIADPADKHVRALADYFGQTTDAMRGHAELTGMLPAAPEYGPRSREELIGDTYTPAILPGLPGAERFRPAEAELAGDVEEWDDDTPLGDDVVALPFLKEVELAAGAGRTAVEVSSTRRLRFGKYSLRKEGIQAEHAVAVTVRGNSMEPVLPDGATVAVNTADTTITDGKTYAIEHAGQLRVKLLYRLPGGGIRIRSINRDEHPDEEYSQAQVEEQEIKVIGRVFWGAMYF
nr:S24 family peptidase [Pseudomonas sp. UBA6718]